MTEGYVYHDLQWARVFQRSCGNKAGRAFGYRLRCELKRHHVGDHAAERGMEWVRWNNCGDIWLTTPGSASQGRLP